MSEDPFARFEQRRIRREQRRMELNKELSGLNAEGEKDAIAIAQLKAIYPDGFPGSHNDFESPVPDAVEPAPAPPLGLLNETNHRGGDLTVKQVAELLLRDAYPNGLSAAQIKGKAFLRYQRRLNPNTLTVSLVRLKPRVRCEGRTWFYVKEGNGVATSALIPDHMAAE